MTFDDLDQPVEGGGAGVGTCLSKFSSHMVTALWMASLQAKRKLSLRLGVAEPLTT